MLRHHIYCLCIVTSLLGSGLAQANRLEQVELYAKTGAMHLALQMIEQEQSALQSNSAQWEKWERLRIKHYVMAQNWSEVINRLALLPDNTSVDFKRWAQTQQVEAQIALGQGQVARQGLRRLLWQSAELQPTTEDYIQWRQLMVQAYLAQGLADDAHLASVRLKQDVGTEQQSDLVLAKIALLQERYPQAIVLLQPHIANTEHFALSLLTQLRGEQLTAAQVLEMAQAQLEQATPRKANLHLVIAEAAKQLQRPDAVAESLEQALVHQQYITWHQSLIAFDVDQLWQAYFDYAVHIANQEQMLIGQEEKWLSLATSIQQDDPVAARALYAFVLLHAESAQLQTQAANAFVKMVQQQSYGHHLLSQLFTKTALFKQKQQIPAAVRHALVDIALARTDLDAAANWMASFESSDTNKQTFMWRLRRAQILVLSQQAKLGATALDTLLATTAHLSAGQLERLLQVVLDLQTAEEHGLAYALFEKTLEHTADAQLEREIYYWMAESRQAQDRYLDAAQLYLRSAMHLDPDSMDPWAQTAYYQAAATLSKAGLFRDARLLFQRLLDVTDDPAQLTSLRRELARLWAMQ